MITAIRAAAAILAGDIAYATHHAHHTPTPITTAAYTVAALILTLCWALGHLHRKDTRR